MKIIYIAGYGRSGSSILSRLLAQQPGVVSLGEFSRIGGYLARDESCTCGAPVSQCAFWAPVAERAQGTTPAQVLRALAADGETTAAIDSSKTAYKDFLLPVRYMRSGADFYLIHLVRRPEHVLQSAQKGRNSDLEDGTGGARPFETARTLVGWVFANTAAAMYRGVLGRRGALLRYEDLLVDPARELRRLEKRFGIDFGKAVAVVEASQPMAAGHEIAGNRTLRSGDTRFHRLDRAPERATGLGWRLFATLSKPIGGAR